MFSYKAYCLPWWILVCYTLLALCCVFGDWSSAFTGSLKNKLRQGEAARRHVCECACRASVECVRIWMPPQIVIFEQSTWESEAKLNFGVVNQCTFSSLSKSNHRWLDQTVYLTVWERGRVKTLLSSRGNLSRARRYSALLHIKKRHKNMKRFSAFLMWNLGGFHPQWKTACRLLHTMRACLALPLGLRCTLELQRGWWMKLVTHKWFASSLLLPQCCRGNRREPHFFFSSFFTLRDRTVSAPIWSCSSFLSSLAFQAWWEKEGDRSLTLQIHFFPASLCSSRPSSARWSTFPSECSRAIRLIFPLPFLLLYLTLPLALPPRCNGFMLRCTFRLCVGWCCGLASGSLW